MGERKRKMYCYHCHDEVEEHDLVKVKVPTITKKGVKNLSKNLHSWCKKSFAPKLITLISEVNKLEMERVTGTVSSTCFHCGKELLEKDAVKKVVPLATKTGIRKYERRFHYSCVEDYVKTMIVEEETKEENTWWEKCYEKFKELLGLPEEKNLDEHAVKRVLGLRIGEYMPNSNVRGIKRGYSFETILYTLIFCTNNINNAFSTMEFKDQKHKIDYAMKIVTNNINFMEQQMNRKKHTEKKMEHVTFEDKTQYEDLYQPKHSSNDKVKELVNSVILKENKELTEIDSLFEEM